MATKVLKEDIIRFRVNKDLKNRFKKMCDDKKINMSELITHMIENEINNYEFKINNIKEIEYRVNNTEKKLNKLKEKLIKK